ncbi:primosomal protein N' [Corynebacterium aquatimens]|uniref:Probable replication restart protein PriA n=1 Tax=Corynebacterium aquatimens TaxID=1190508 RepID=A0A931GS47_9CORY|nr:primosomal protein N' [Corynebacterium aquatimens]MBG6121677.1 primosomal protein N' (replication factor Y) [Corynebacterium aquatimens]WJY65784.1 Primosomal protein N' [Corynebacterium aquatimens]
MADTHDPSREVVVRVLPLLGVPHLDRGFDYLASGEDADLATPGVKVRVRFAGRLVDAIVLERPEQTEFEGTLRYIERVISPEVVYPPRIAKLVDALADRYAATRSDIIRTCIPPRHAKGAETATDTPWDKLGASTEPDLSAWSMYEGGTELVDDVIAETANETAESSAPPRAGWQVAPGASWTEPLAALAAKVARDGGGVLIVVPDQRDVDRLSAALREIVGPRQITTLTASQGPQARYSRYLSVLHGQGRLVIGTRSAAYAPVANLKLAVVMFDGDESLVNQMAPYDHAREVLTTRSSIEKCALIIGGFARTPETQLLIDAGWLRSVAAPREILRQRAPRIHAAGDSDFELERDPRARHARLPGVAFQAARSALERNEPVLFQVPRTGYIQTLACGTCREPARCRACNGPLGLPSSREAAAPTCRWCGRIETMYTCPACGSHRLRAVVLGTERTAEELGRAFPSTKVLTSFGEGVRDDIEHGPAIVVATPGAEPVVLDGAYGAAVLLDTWALLNRPDLRAHEDAFEKWVHAATLVAPVSDGGEVVVVADAALEVVQHLIRWDVEAQASYELSQRRDVRFPPAVHMAAVDSPRASLDEFLSILDRSGVPEPHEVLGPVDLPPGVDLPGEWDRAQYGEAQRVLIRTPLNTRTQLGKALRAATVTRASLKSDLPLRIQVNPTHIG